jgi:proline racemase
VVGPDRLLAHDSIVGTTFRGRVIGETTVSGRPAIVPEVDGMAYRAGDHRFVLDPRDSLGTGFVLR